MMGINFKAQKLKKLKEKTKRREQRWLDKIKSDDFLVEVYGKTREDMAQAAEQRAQFAATQGVTAHGGRAFRPGTQDPVAAAAGQGLTDAVPERRPLYSSASGHGGSFGEGASPMRAKSSAGGSRVKGLGQSASAPALPRSTTAHSGARSGRLARTESMASIDEEEGGGNQRGPKGRSSSSNSRPGAYKAKTEPLPPQLGREGSMVLVEGSLMSASLEKNVTIRRQRSPSPKPKMEATYPGFGGEHTPLTHCFRDRHEELELGGNYMHVAGSYRPRKVYKGGGLVDLKKTKRLQRGKAGTHSAPLLWETPVPIDTGNPYSTDGLVMRARNADAELAGYTMELGANKGQYDPQAAWKGGGVVDRSATVKLWREKSKKRLKTAGSKWERAEVVEDAVEHGLLPPKPVEEETRDLRSRGDFRSFRRLQSTGSTRDLPVAPAGSFRATPLTMPGSLRSLPTMPLSMSTRNLRSASPLANESSISSTLSKTHSQGALRPVTTASPSKLSRAGHSASSPTMGKRGKTALPAARRTGALGDGTGVGDGEGAGDGGDLSDTDKAKHVRVKEGWSPPPLLRSGPSTTSQRSVTAAGSMRIVRPQKGQYSGAVTLDNYSKSHWRPETRDRWINKKGWIGAGPPPAPPKTASHSESIAPLL